MKSLQGLILTILITAGSLAAGAAATASDSLLATSSPESAHASALQSPAVGATPAAPKARTVRKSSKFTLQREPCVPPDQIPGGAESDASIEDQNTEQSTEQSTQQNAYGAQPVAQAKATASLGGKRRTPVRRVFCVCISSPDKCAQYQEKQIKPAF